MEIACSAVVGAACFRICVLCSGVGVVCGLVTVFMVFVVIKSVSSVQIMAKVSERSRSLSLARLSAFCCLSIPISVALCINLLSFERWQQTWFGFLHFLWVVFWVHCKHYVVLQKLIVSCVPFSEHENYLNHKSCCRCRLT